MENQMYKTRSVPVSQYTYIKSFTRTLFDFSENMLIYLRNSK